MKTIGSFAALVSLSLLAGSAAAEGLPKPEVRSASPTRAGTTWILEAGTPTAEDLGRAAELCRGCAADQIVVGLLAGDPLEGLLEPASDSDSTGVLFVEADRRAPTVRVVTARREAGTAAVTVLEAGPELDLDQETRFEGDSRNAQGNGYSVAFSTECTSAGLRLHFELRPALSGTVRYDVYRREPGVGQPWMPIASVIPTGGIHSNDVLDPADASADRSRFGTEYRVEAWVQGRRSPAPESEMARPIRPIWKLVALATERGDC